MGILPRPRVRSPVHAPYSCTIAGRLPVALAVALILPVSGTRAETVTTDFENGFGPWVPLFSGTWEIQNQSGNQVAALTVAGVDRPPVRRPRAYLFLPGHTWKDYSLTVKAKTLEPASLSFRDVVLIFGYEDDTHYYYAHTSSRSDSTHTVIMKVNGNTRGTIQLETNPPPALNGNWQTIRVKHAASGKIEVFVDNMSTPRLTAQDTSYPVGAVAFGCFDDRALFDDVSVSGTEVAVPVAAPVVTRSGPNQIALTYGTQQGFTYQVLTGTELPSFTASGPAVTGHGGTEQALFSTVDVPQRFFEVVTTNPMLAGP